MKLKRMTYRRACLLGLAVYLALLVIVSGSYIYRSYRNYHYLVEIAQEDLSFYQENGTFSPSVIENQSNNFVYDADGRCLDAVSSDNLDRYYDVDAYAQKLPRDTQTYRFKFSLSLRYLVAVAVSLPTEDGGLFLLLKEIPEAGRTLLMIFGGLTLLCVLCLIALLYALRCNRVIEKFRREYVDNVTHELKSPIASIRALAEPIQDGLIKDPETLKRYSTIMLTETANLEHSVSQMLELSRLQNRHVPVDRQICSPQTPFQETLTKYETLCQEFGLSFSVTPPLNQLSHLDTDPELCERILQILLDNAFKFTKANGTIQIRFRSRRRRIIVSVTNDGTCIPKEDQARIFERFYQSSKGREQKGSGLGLSIAQEIASTLRERIWLEKSVPGETTFSFTVSAAGPSGLSAEQPNLTKEKPDKGSAD